VIQDEKNRLEATGMLKFLVRTMCMREW